MCNEDKIWAMWKDLESDPPAPPTQEIKPEEITPKQKPDWDLILGM